MKESLIRKLQNKVTLEQLHKFMKLIVICMIFMVFSEGLFEIPALSRFFGEDLILGKSGWIVYVIIWLVMVAQVTIIPIPALPILIACNQIPNLVGSNGNISGLFSLQTLFFVGLCTSATLVGCIAAYWLGRSFGKLAVKWIAGDTEDYDKWSDKLNSKFGKWLYAITVFLPVFPDDLISIVVGSLKMDFLFYTIINAVGKFIGLYVMLIFIRLPGISIFFGKSNSNFPIALTFYVVILLGSIITQIITTKLINKKQFKNVKLEVIKDEILYRIKRENSNYRDLIIDYKIDKGFKTYLGNKVIINKLFEVNEENLKNKVRVIIKCKVSNYWQIIFDKTYDLTEKYTTYIGDVETCL